MKRTTTARSIFAALILSLIFATASAQNVKTDARGNYIAVTKDTTRASNDELTGKTYTDAKGITYPVYISARGKLYVIRTSKNTGKTYKFYLKP